MWDFPGNPDILRIARQIYEANGVVAAMCHRPAALVDVQLSNGNYLVAGHDVAAFTNAEEEAVGLTSVVPLPLPPRLTERGAAHLAASDFQPKVVTSGRVVTGHNPASAAGRPCDRSGVARLGSAHSLILVDTL